MSPSEVSRRARFSSPHGKGGTANSSLVSPEVKDVSSRLYQRNVHVERLSAIRAKAHAVARVDVAAKLHALRHDAFFRDAFRERVLDEKREHRERERKASRARAKSPALSPIILKPSSHRDQNDDHHDDQNDDQNDHYHHRGGDGEDPTGDATGDGTGDGEHEVEDAEVKSTMLTESAMLKERPAWRPGGARSDSAASWRSSSPGGVPIRSSVSFASSPSRTGSRTQMAASGLPPRSRSSAARKRHVPRLSRGVEKLARARRARLQRLQREPTLSPTPISSSSPLPPIVPPIPRGTES